MFGLKSTTTVPVVNVWTQKYNPDTGRSTAQSGLFFLTPYIAPTAVLFVKIISGTAVGCVVQ